MAVHQMQGDVNLQWANDSRNGSERRDSFNGKSKGVVEWFENSGPGLGMAQLTECLLSTHQALGLIPSTAQSRVGITVQAWNQSTQEGEAGGSEVQSHL